MTSSRISPSRGPSMASRPPSDIGDFLARLTRALNERRVPFMLIGGQAVLLHGRPRFTEDIDVTLGISPENLDLIRDVCGELGLSPLPPDVARFVRDTFVLPVRGQDPPLRVDFVFSTTPYERQAIARSDLVDVSGERVPFASVEDLIIHKLFAGRAVDWEDAISVVRRKGGSVDWQYVEDWLRQFASVPGREDLPQQLEKLRAEAD